MQIIWLVIYYLITIGGYFYFSHIPTENHFLTALDKLIPTIPVFVIPYLFATLVYVALPIIFYLKLNLKKTREYLTAQIVASLISYVIFWLYPTSIVREPISGSDILSNILRWIHSADRPSAAFPSGHVFQSIIVAYFLWIWFPKTRPFIVVILPLIIASTVFTKQHYLPDIFGGIVIALFSIYLAKIITPKLP